MHFDRRFFLVLGASLVWALMVSAMFYRLSARPAHEQKAEQRRPVVVATKTLPVGAMVGRDAVQLHDVPENFYPAGGFSRIEDVENRPVISPIQPGEPVVDARLAAKGSGMGLAPLIPSGMRALSVRVNDVVGVSGFILPGMHVDVLVTGRPEGSGDTVTRTVLQNIAVLSAGQTLQNDGKSQSIQVPVVTLLLTPHEAEALTLANSEGKVQLVLRNSNDDQMAPSSGSRLHDLYGGMAIAQAAPQPQIVPERPVVARAPVSELPAPKRPEPKAIEPPKPLTDEIEVIHGHQKTIEVFARKGGGE